LYLSKCLSAQIPLYQNNIREGVCQLLFSDGKKNLLEGIVAEINTTVITLEKIARSLCAPLAEFFQFEEADPEKTNAEQVLREVNMKKPCPSDRTGLSFISPPYPSFWS